MEIKAYTSHEDFSSNLYLLINNNEIILGLPFYNEEMKKIDFDEIFDK